MPVVQYHDIISSNEGLWKLVYCEYCFIHESDDTVEPLNKGHLGTSSFCPD